MVYVLPSVILFLCFSVLLALQLPRMGKRELNLVLFVRLFNLRLFGFVCFLFLLVPASVAQLDWRPGGSGFDLRRGRQYSFVEIDHEIFSMVILFLPLIQEGRLSVSGERMCTILFNR